MALPKLKPVLMPEGIGEKIDLRTKLKAELDTLTKTVGDFQKLIDGVELALMEQLDAQKTTSGGGKRATVTINESIVPNIKDWDLFAEYIYKNKYLHLLQRRPAVLACREIFELRGKLPGAEAFTKRTLNFTTKKG